MTTVRQLREVQGAEKANMAALRLDYETRDVQLKESNNKLDKAVSIRRSAEGREKGSECVGGRKSIALNPSPRLSQGCNTHVVVTMWLQFCSNLALYPYFFHRQKNCRLSSSDTQSKLVYIIRKLEQKRCRYICSMLASSIVRSFCMICYVHVVYMYSKL